MSGNSFGTLFKVTTFGESHGPALGCVIDGCPPGLTLDESLIQPFLDKRKPGTSRYTSQRREEDAVEILSGVFEGKTTGAPIALLIKNSDARSKDYQDLKEVFRPGHADFTFHHKYGHRDYRGGGRASARETVARVAAGAVAALYLQEKLQLQIIGYLEQIGDLVLDFENAQQILENPFFCPNNKQIALLEDKIETLRRAGDSTGAQIRIVVKNMPIGLGDPVFDKLDASLAYALMSIPAVKGVEIGSGFAAVRQLGSEHRDEQNAAGFLSNHAGGVLGGISTGQDLELRIAVKPTSSIVKPGLTLDIHGQETSVSVKGRHDPCAGIRAVPIAEAMVALVLMDHYLRDRAQNF